MMRIMHREVVEKKEWSDDQTMLDLVSIAESTLDRLQLTHQRSLVIDNEGS